MTTEILVAVDVSQHSEKVVAFACTLAKSLSGRVILMHVVPGINVPEEYLKYAQAENISDPTVAYLQTMGEQVLLKLGRLCDANGVEHEEVREVGSPADMITRTVQSRRVSLVVVGLHGLHGLGLIRSLGSVARRVVENSPVPVVVVP